MTMTHTRSFASLLWFLLFTPQLCCAWFLHPAPDAILESPQSAALRQHSNVFTPEIVEVTEGVYSAVGYALANVILVEGPTGSVIVDTTEAKESAEEVLEKFKNITQIISKPIVAILQTHNHGDHVWGTKVFQEYAREQGVEPEIWCHQDLPYYRNIFSGPVNNIILKRTFRQMATVAGVTSDDRINCGLGKDLLMGAGYTRTPIAGYCTHFLDEDSKTLQLAGMNVVLTHTPGETVDQMAAYFVEKDALMVGDNFYTSFPNLYAIRGTVPRPTEDWIQSLDFYRKVGAEFMVPSHTRPVIGREQVYQSLTNYRDAVQIVLDQTFRYMDRDLSPDQFVHMVELPSHLQADPNLQEFYGTVAWSSRHVYEAYVGWFDGNPAHLDPLPKSDRAWMLAQELGGIWGMYLRARRAYRWENYKWALELADLLYEINPTEFTQDLLVACLRRVGERHTSANGRHYLLTKAMEIEGSTAIARVNPRAKSLSQQMAIWAVRVDVEASEDTNQVTVVRFPDETASFVLHVRRGVCVKFDDESEFPMRPAGVDEQVLYEQGTWPPLRYADIVVEMTKDQWGDAMFGTSVLMMNLNMVVSDAIHLSHFLDLFDSLTP